jgi:hypothetical protein
VGHEVRWIVHQAQVTVSLHRCRDPSSLDAADGGSRQPRLPAGPRDSGLCVVGRSRGQHRHLVGLGDGGAAAWAILPIRAPVATRHWPAAGIRHTPRNGYSWHLSVWLSPGDLTRRFCVSVIDALAGNFDPFLSIC